MKIISLDPGYDRLGIAVLEIGHGKERLLYSTCISTSREDAFDERLLSASDQFGSLCTLYSPEEIALEKVYFAKNQKTAMYVARMIGALTLETRRRGMALFEYTPPEIKQAVTGDGASNKSDIIRIVPMLIALEHTPRLDDEWDAIAVGLAHSAIRKTRLLETL